MLSNGLDPDQDRQNVGPDLDLKPFDTLIVFLEEFFFNSQILKESAKHTKSMKITQHAKS